MAKNRVKFKNGRQLFVKKKLSTIDGSPTLAILDRFSQDNLELFFIGIGRYAYRGDF